MWRLKLAQAGTLCLLDGMFCPGQSGSRTECRPQDFEGAAEAYTAMLQHTQEPRELIAALSNRAACRLEQNQPLAAVADCEEAVQQLTGDTCQQLSSWVQHQQELLLHSTEQASQAAATDGAQQGGPQGVSSVGQAMQNYASAVRLLMRQGVAYGQLRRCASH